MGKAPAFPSLLHSLEEQTQVISPTSQKQCLFPHHKTASGYEGVIVVVPLQFTTQAHASLQPRNHPHVQPCEELPTDRWQLHLKGKTREQEKAGEKWGSQSCALGRPPGSPASQAG